MTLKEKLSQVIKDLKIESKRYPRMKTTDVAYFLSEIISKEYDEEVKQEIKKL